MAIRNIITFEDETLRKKSRLIEKFDEKTLQLTEDLIDTLASTNNGVGLAAPQVGVLRRICVIDIGEGVQEFINPEIVVRKGMQEATEGCLSCPGRYGVTRRPRRVKVRAFNKNGEEFTLWGDGLMAIALCHEIDHLDGVLFVDHIIREMDED